jgi:HSP20 family protein
MKAMMELGFPRMRRDLGRLFDELWDLPVEESQEMTWMPRLDVVEANGHFLVRAECPGMEAKDVRLSIDDGVLTLEGEKHTEKEEKDERTYRRERRYGSFLRRIPLPTTIDPAKVKAEFKNGLLTITLPKSAAPSEQHIPIHIG